MRSHLQFLGEKNPRLLPLSYFPTAVGGELSIDHPLPLSSTHPASDGIRREKAVPAPVYHPSFSAPHDAGSGQGGGEISAAAPAGPPVEPLPESTCAAFVSGQ